MADRISSSSDYASIRDSIRVDTLNRWGNSYLRNQEAGLVVKSSKQDKFYLVNNLLRPLWSKIALIEKSLTKRRNRYAELIDVMTTLKTCGFRHDAEDLMGSFSAHLQWIEKNGLGRFFETSVLEVLDSLQLLKNSSDPLERLKPFVKFWAKSCDHLWSSATLTLEDQKYWALLKLQHKYADSYFPDPNRSHHIFVDEFQDVNPLDIALVRELVRVNRSTLTIVGDDDQAIFEWRGATPAFILDPDEHLGGDFETHTLAVNYRCPRNVVGISQELIANNTIRVPKAVSAHSSTDAEVVLELLDSHDDVVDYVLELARDATAAGHAKALAVLARKKSQLLPLEIMMTAEEIPFYAKEDLNVLLSDAFRELKVLLEATATQHQRLPSHQVASLMVECCNKVESYALRKSEREALYAHFVRARPRTIHDCLAELQSYGGNLGSQTGANAGVAFAFPIAEVLEAKTVGDCMSRIESRMAGLQRHFSKSEDDVFYKDPPFMYLGDYAERYGDRFFDFIDHVESATAEMQIQAGGDEAGSDEANRAVHLMTALRAKGKEFGTVVILDANDGVWPIRFAESVAELEQERRLFYVAVTRAQSRLVFLPVRRLAGQHVTASPYLGELGLEIPE